jgi:transcriptional regulator with XRE-family HTH domain
MPRATKAIRTIATLRRAQNITLVQLAEALGVSQGTWQSYEVWRRRLPVSALPTVAKTLSVSLDELFGTQARPRARAAASAGQRRSGSSTSRRWHGCPRPSRSSSARCCATCSARPRRD